MKLLAHNDGIELRGNERQLLLLCEGLRERGHDVLVSCRHDAPLSHALSENSIATTQVRPRGDLDVLAMHRFGRLVQDYQPKAVLLTSWKRVVTAAYASRHGFQRARVVVRLGTVREFPGGWKGSVLRFAFRRFVDRLVVNSDDVAEAWLRSAPWFDAGKLHVIANAVQPVPGRAQRAGLGAAADTPIIVYVGGLESRKGIDVLLRALASLPRLQLLVAGDGPERNALARLAVELGVGERVRWLGHRSDVPDVLASSDVFVLPSRQDSLANALLEAMTAGLPVIATEGSGVGEALGARKGREPAGWVVPPDNVDALAGAIRQALQPTSAERGREAQWRARNWYTVPRMVAAYEQVLFS